LEGSEIIILMIVVVDVHHTSIESNVLIRSSSTR